MADLKVGYCKCGKCITMAAMLPDAETDKDIIKDFRNLALQGRKIDYISHGELKNFRRCECLDGPKKEKQPELF